MRSRTIAFALGVITLHQLAVLPAMGWCALLLCSVPATFSSRWWSWPAAWLTGFLWALLSAATIHAERLPADLEGRDVWVEGVVASPPTPAARAVRFQFDMQYRRSGNQRIPDVRRVRLSWYGEAPALVAGERWLLQVRLKRPRGFANPGGFDYERWLFQQRIQATGYVRSDPQNRRLGYGGHRYALQAARQRLGQQLDDALDGRARGGIVKALTIGMRDAISGADREVLQRTGTGHLVAISGLHVGLVAGFGFWIAGRVWRWVPRAPLMCPAPLVSAVGAILAAVAYAALAGFSLPTQRAVLMVLVVMLSVLRQRRSSASQTLSFALLGVLVVDPEAVLAAGFWMSFGAVTALLLVVTRRTGRLRPWWQWVRLQGVVAVGTLPLVVVLFHQVPLLGALANLLAVPWFSFVVVPLSLLGTAILAVNGAAGGALLQLAGYAIQPLWAVLEVLSQWHYATRVFAAPPMWALVAAVCGSLWLLAPRGWPSRWLGTVGLLPMLVLLPAGPAAGQFWLTVLDVGQGLAVVVRTASHVLIYDTGPRFSERFDAGHAVIAPYLRYAGIGHIDRLVVSHGDNDHIGGARAVLRAFTVNDVLTGVPDRLTQAGARACRAGQSWTWDEVRFEVLHPGGEQVRRSNNRSCVLRIMAAGGNALLTGDIERDVEMELLDHNEARLRSHILVAPHHGSLTSSTPTFLAAVQPQVAVFPVGYRNRFGFPKPEVVQRYQRLGAHLYDTARHGAVTIRVTGAAESLQIEPWRLRDRRHWRSP